MRIQKDYDDSSLGRYVYVTKPMLFNSFLSAVAGDVLAWLINLYQFRKQGGFVDRDGFFRCSRQEMKEGMFLVSDRPAQRPLGKLEELGLIEVKMIGNPAKRHIRIHFKELEKSMSRGLRMAPPQPGTNGTPSKPGTDVAPSIKLTKELTKNKLSRVSAKREGAGFFEETNGEVNEVDARFTKRLQKALQQNGKLPRRCRPSTWLEQFRILRGDHSEEEIDQVLTWYTDHIKDKYTPHARSGRSFRSKYLQIKEAMERDQGPLLLKPISEDAQFIVNTLTNELSWPDKDQLKKCVQISYDNIQDFAIRLRRLRSSDNEEVVFFAEWWQFSESSFVEDYLRKLFYRFRRREADNWDGKLVHLAFQVDSKFLDGQFRETTRKTKRLILQELGYESGASHRK